MELNITASNPLDFMKAHNLILSEFHKFIEADKNISITAEYGSNKGFKIMISLYINKLYNLVNYIPSSIYNHKDGDLELIYRRKKLSEDNGINSFIVTYRNVCNVQYLDLEIEDESNCRENN